MVSVTQWEVVTELRVLHALLQLFIAALWRRQCDHSYIMVTCPRSVSRPGSCPPCFSVSFCLFGHLFLGPTFGIPSHPIWGQFCTSWAIWQCQETFGVLGIGPCTYTRQVLYHLSYAPPPSGELLICQDLEQRVLRVLTGLEWIEARGTGKSPTVHRTVSPTAVSLAQVQGLAEWLKWCLPSKYETLSLNPSAAKIKNIYYF
jgi:hypothetical protein